MRANDITERWFGVTNQGRTNAVRAESILRGDGGISFDSGIHGTFSNCVERRVCLDSEWGAEHRCFDYPRRRNATPLALADVLCKTPPREFCAQRFVATKGDLRGES